MAIGFCSKRDIRGFAARLADSPLLQHFCTLSRVDGIQIPAKSTLQRYDQWWPETQARELTCQLLGNACTAPAAGAARAGRSGNGLPGHHLSGRQHPLPGRLGAAARRHPHPDEGRELDPRPRLQGELVPNAEKILSLYEPDVQVIVRKKAGAEVEFGNPLLLAENPQGLILDWELFQDRAPADSLLLPRTIGHLEQLYGPVLKAVGADRGFDSATNRIGLERGP